MNKSKLFSLIVLTVLIGVNIYLHKTELSIKSEVNDNIFQYALVDEAKNIWKNVISLQTSPFYLVDSFNERWNEGFALSTYYSHLPQAVVSFASYVSTIPTIVIFNWTKFLLLILLPVSFFISARILGFSYLYSIITTILSHLVITDGLYGIDITSYVFRGWGLSSQLLAIFFLPLSFAFTYNYLTKGKKLEWALLFNFLLAQSHSGVFLMTALAYPFLFAVTLWEIFEKNSLHKFKIKILFNYLNNNEDLRPLVKHFLIFVFWIFFLLSYYLIPFFLYGQYRSFSYWDPLWKFNSFGLFQILSWTLNGELFDFNRLPLVTLSVFAGIFAVLISRDKRHRIFGLLFIFYFLCFIGRTSILGRFVDFIPGFSEFHLHRFIVMIHFIGIFLAAYVIELSINKIKFLINHIRLTNIQAPIKEILITVIIICSIFLFKHLEQPILEYAKYNDKWINENNALYIEDESSYIALLQAIKKANPGRIYAGRPGNWGRDFKVGDTPIYMALSRDGFKGIGFAPESWSPNSEFDTFFNENDLNSYNLYNITHVVYPGNLQAPKFFKPMGQFGKYNLYEINVNGWFASGTSSTIVTSNKTHLFNIVHYWMTTDAIKNREYPQISFSKTSNTTGKNEIRMVDLNRYITGKDNKQISIWEKSPLYDGHDSQVASLVKTNEKVFLAGYGATFKLNKDCIYCVAILKQTFHPNWAVKVNGESVKAYPVFPFYIGIQIQKAGSYTIEVIYQPNQLKIMLLLMTVIVTTGYLIRRRDKS